MENILYPTIGGVLIGVAATMMLGLNGKITGISGIIGGSLKKLTSHDYWRLAFIFGLVFGGGILLLVAPHLFEYEFKASYIEMVIAGLLVGYGTRLGSGCTSGHGVCGLPRLAPRSLVATLSFIIAGVIAVFVRGLF